MKTRTFVDHVVVHARAGRGGDGSGSFRREACVPEGGPDGGDGGRGGHVIFKGSRNVNSLITLFFSPNLSAEDGVPGQRKQMYGRRGRDLVALVPCGTEVFDNATGALVADIVGDGQEFIAAKGGKGGFGNVHFKSAVHQAPEEFTPGEPGQQADFRLELKTIADAGLIGFPNAGKSSLLTCISDAHPKIASYPFTTLNPIVGTVEYPDFSQLRIADIPGIIEGAADGVGLGIDFLKHIARSRVMVFIIDMAGTDGREPWKDYAVLHSEIEQHDPDLLQRPMFVIANKMDQAAAIEKLPRFIKETGTEPIGMSALDRNDAGVQAFKRRLWELLRPEPRGSWTAPAPAESNPDAGSLTEESLKAAPFLDLGKKPRKSRAKRHN